MIRAEDWEEVSTTMMSVKRARLPHGWLILAMHNGQPTICFAPFAAPGSFWGDPTRSLARKLPGIPGEDGDATEEFPGI